MTVITGVVATIMFFSLSMLLSVFLPVMKQMPLVAFSLIAGTFLMGYRRMETGRSYAGAMVGALLSIFFVISAYRSPQHWDLSVLAHILISPLLGTAGDQIGQRLRQ